MTPPALDDHLGFVERVEDFAVQKLISKLRVEAFAVAVLPWAFRFVVGRSRSNGDDPFSNQFGDELRAIVRTEMTWHAAQDEQVRKHIDNVGRVQPPALSRQRRFRVSSISMPISYARHRFPPVVIQHAIWLYLRFTLSYRDVEVLLAERGLDISY